MVNRAVWVNVRYTDVEGQEHTDLFVGRDAIVLQHEIDHLEGVLFSDRAIQESLVWQEPSSEGSSISTASEQTTAPAS
jgi:peptide deformylase